jgi:hypothetical protein
MFSRDDLKCLDLALLNDWRFVRLYPGLHYVVYPQVAFRDMDSEQYLRITRAPRQPGDNGVKFWVSAEMADTTNAPRATYLAPYLLKAQLRSTSEGEFNRLIAEHCSHLLVSPLLPLHGPQGFVGALVMYNLDTELIVSTIAEYEDEFIHFYWDTTA